LVLSTVKRKEDEPGMIYRKRAFKVFTAVSTLQYNIGLIIT
jgi:hypothetical protein